MSQESLDELCKKANQALAVGQYHESCRLFQHALALKPDRSDLHYGLGTVSFLLGELAASARHFKEVTRLEPLRAKAYINLGAVYDRLGQYDDAIATLQRGIQLDNKRGEGFYNLGLVYRQLGQCDLAIQAYREAIRLSPHLADAHLNVGNLLFEKEQFALASAHYRAALELRPNWTKARVALANAVARQPVPGPAHVPAAETGTPGPGNLDPKRLIDPALHGAALRDVRRLVTETDTLSRQLAEVLRQDVEVALMGLSNCLLFPNDLAYNLTDQLDKFDLVVTQVHDLQKALQTRSQQVDHLSEQFARV